MVESLGSTVRLGWTGVAGATKYRIIILNEEGTAVVFFHNCFVIFLFLL